MAKLDVKLSSCCCDCMSKGHLINILVNKRKEAIKNYFQEESSLTNEFNLSDEDELPFPTDGSQQLSSHQVHMHLKVSRLGNNSWNILKRIDANYVSVDVCAGDKEKESDTHVPRVEQRNFHQCSAI